MTILERIAAWIIFTVVFTAAGYLFSSFIQWDWKLLYDGVPMRLWVVMCALWSFLLSFVIIDDISVEVADAPAPEVPLNHPYEG